jgi:hypothetical protein
LVRYKRFNVGQDRSYINIKKCVDLQKNEQLFSSPDLKLKFKRFSVQTEAKSKTNINS